IAGAVDETLEVDRDAVGAAGLHAIDHGGDGGGAAIGIAGEGEDGGAVEQGEGEVDADAVSVGGVDGGAIGPAVGVGDAAGAVDLDGEPGQVGERRPAEGGEVGHPVGVIAV